MGHTSRQPLTSSQDEIDAFAFVMLAVELERKKRAFVSWLDALKTTEVNSASTTKATVVPEPRSHHEGLYANPGEFETLP